MRDFSDYLATDPKYYYILDSRDKPPGVPDCYAICYVKGGSQGFIIMEDDQEADAFCRWLIEHGAKVIHSSDEIDCSRNADKEWPPTIDIIDLE